MTDAERIYGAALVVDEQLRIIKDRYGLYEQLQERHDLLREECDAAAKAIDAMETMHEELGREYKGALAALETLSLQLKLSHDVYSKTIDDLEVQLRFWRQAAEHAVNGWNALEDKHESLLEAARNVIEGTERIGAWQALKSLIDEEPALPFVPIKDPALGPHIVEEEKPL